MSKDIKKALEHCVEWNCGNCPNRDELGSGETVCRGRLLPEVLEYVSDLEAKLSEKDEQLEYFSKRDDEQEKQALFHRKSIKELRQQLAESEEENKKLIKALNGEVFINYKLPMENAKLKQQLAEKKQEIESLRENSLSKRIFKEKLIPSHCMEQYEKYEQQIDKLTQDKILFAVEQLTQAIKNIKKCNYKDFGIMYQSDAIAVIDNQINELKGK